MKNFDLDDQLGFNLYRVAMSFKREHAQALRDFRLTPEQWQALATLWRYGAMNQSEIARVTLQDPPAVSRMLARMESDGWLRRQSDPNDARSSIVQLTAEGMRLRDVLPSKLVRHFREYLKDFPEAKQKQLLSLLKELRFATADRTTDAPSRRT